MCAGWEADARRGTALEMDTMTPSQSSVYSRFGKEVLVAWLACTPLAFAVGWIAADLLAGFDASEVPALHGWWNRIVAALIAPLVESYVMVLIFAVLERLMPDTMPFRHRTFALVIASATVWSFIHGYFALPWGVLTFWPFVVFSYMFLRWEKHSLALAITAAAAVHVLHNSTVVALSIMLSTPSKSLP